MKRFKDWCRDNGVGVTTGYKMLNEGKIEAVKVGKLTYITDEAHQKWLKSLPKYKEA